MKKFIIAICFSMLLLANSSISKVSAGVNDFVVNDFHGKYQIFNDVDGGRMVVSETITVDFYDSNHGLLRAIPNSYKRNPLHLNILSVLRDGSQESYSTYKQANNEVLKIGLPYKTITGTHKYEINYEMRNIISFNKNKNKNIPEWYWDINGDQWQQGFQSISGELIVPSDWIENRAKDISCYTGKYGSKESLCEIQLINNGAAFSASTFLQPGQTLTVAVPFREGVFKPLTLLDKLKNSLPQLIGIAFGLLASSWALFLWWRWGKDYEGRGVIIPEYEVPNNLSPAELGLIYDYRLDYQDLTATLIDLAVRGYIKIHENQTKKIGLFKQYDYKFELLNNSTKKLKYFERSLLKVIFPLYTKGELIDVSKIKPDKMHTAINDIRKSMAKEMEEKYGLIEVLPSRRSFQLYIILFAAIVILLFARPGFGWLIGSFLAIGSAIFSLIFMRRRSHAGVEVFDKARGLRLYLNTAEKDRLKKMQSVDRPYAAPAPTVELFEKFLPYAVALGVENSWARQFNHIYNSPPDWYSGDFDTFNTIIFTDSLMSSMSAASTNFAPSTSSSDSGIGGDGFSGGGGGGGGGGGW